MTILQRVPIDLIDHNPFRNVRTYPFVERKVEALMRSIEAVGLWEGIIARRHGDRYQLAFGHHRYEAARRAGIPSITLIIRELDDEHMLQFMGRENAEDYTSDFLAMLETWEAAWKWVTSRDVTSPQPVEVARVVGWVVPRSDRPTLQQMNRTADACNSAYRLINEGLITRSDLVDLTVNEAREICTRASANVDRIEKAGKKFQTPAAHIDASKRAIGKAVVTTAAESREGTVRQADLRTRVDGNAYRHARAFKQVRETPLFSVFGKQLADGIAKMLKEDVAAEKLDEIARDIGELTSEDDLRTLRRLEFELEELVERADKYRKKMILTKEKVVPLSVVKEIQ